MEWALTLRISHPVIRWTKAVDGFIHHLASVPSPNDRHRGKEPRPQSSGPGSRHLFFSQLKEVERETDTFSKKKKMWAWKELWNFTKILVLKYYVGDNSKSTSSPSPRLSIEATLCWGSEPGPLLQIRLSSLIRAWRPYCSFWEKRLRRGGRRPGMLLQERPLITCVGWHGSFSGPPLLISERKDVDHEFSSRTFSNIWVIWSWLGVGVVLVASSE